MTDSTDTRTPTVLITGSNRGIGLALARGYAAQGWNVLATCRRPAQAADLRALAEAVPGVEIAPLDVTSDDDVAALADRWRDRAIDVLLNNAGIYGTLARQSLGAFDFDEGLRVIDVNALGALRVSAALLDHVAASRQRCIVSLGGGLGTQGIGASFPGHYFMKMSKAAHLMAMGVLQAETRDRGVVVVMISPGRVDTQLMRDSGYTGPSLTPEDSARRVMDRIAALTPAMHGRLVTTDGQLVPW
jgi:NAD(P)-dependent dehydrogenase (short-subunit alcohol dehydrogenase family)